jgi:NAD(P)H-quinone oxidoreductase subunit 6
MHAIANFVSGPAGEFVIFAGLAALTVFSALAVVMARRVTHACLALLPCFVGVAGLYGLLNAPVMVAMQLLIYAGGITVLLLFAIFLLERRAGPIVASNHYVVPAVLTAGLMGIVVLAAIQTADFRARSFLPPAPELKGADGREAASPWYGYTEQTEAGPRIGEASSSNLQRTGFYFLTYYLLPFELSSLVLVVSMVGAILMARRQKAWVAAGVTREEVAGPGEAS